MGGGDVKPFFSLVQLNDSLISSHIDGHCMWNVVYVYTSLSRIKTGVFYLEIWLDAFHWYWRRSLVDSGIQLLVLTYVISKTQDLYSNTARVLSGIKTWMNDVVVLSDPLRVGCTESRSAQLWLVRQPDIYVFFVGSNRFLHDRG